MTLKLSFYLAGLTIAWAPALASAASIASNIDTQVTEALAGDGSGSGGDTEMNARFHSSNAVNEFIVVRFDLAGVDKSIISDASIDLTLTRTSGNNLKDQRIFGVNSSAAGLNTFDETVVFNTTPGLLTDNDLNTQSVVDADTTFIGDFKFAADPGAGAIATVDQGLLDTTSLNDPTENSLVGYLQSLGVADQAVFLIGGAGVSTGQFRIVTTEGGSAPVLNYSAVPEPTSLLLGLVGIAALMHRRS